MPNNYPQLFNNLAKVKNLRRVHSFEDGTEVKLQFEINTPLLTPKSGRFHTLFVTQAVSPASTCIKVVITIKGFLGNLN